ncbi:MAG TPA: acido-empty-quinoprotein group A, partial [Acidobacteriaceae bacterium]|nr:acido-empty-quinoprotein group A [Acidobacteriaceae bacterium]
MRISRRLPALFLLAFPLVLSAQGLDAAALSRPLSKEWVTFNGDYSGQRFSPLKQINPATIKTLNLAWIYRLNAGATPGTLVGGEGAGTRDGGRGDPTARVVKASPLMVKGVLYFATPDNAWAVDARSGRELWHYFWRTRGGMHVGNRGVGMYGSYLFFETPDGYLVSLDAGTGRERWHKQVVDFKRQYYLSAAPIVIGHHVLVGTSGDMLDVPGFLEARDPETGELQWRWFTEPAKKGDPGAETWPDEYSMRHGGGMTWMPGTYDPELKLYFVGTGNPNPVMAGQSREGTDLFTCSIVALNVDTGKPAWYFQASPHDTHDWDSVQTPVLIDGEIDGKPRKLLAQADRNGYYFLLDRVTGKAIVSRPFLETMNWSKGVDAQGVPIPDAGKEPSVAGVLVSPPSGGATNWPAPSFDPTTGLFYAGTFDSYSVFYLTDTDPHPEGFAATQRRIGGGEASLRALDYKTGKTIWKHDYPGGGGIAGVLSTGGGLVFSGDGSQHLIAFDATDG